MKTLDQFLEATAIAPKAVMSVAKKTASSDKMAQKLTQIQQKRQNQRIAQKKVGAPAQTKAGKALPPAKNSSAIVKSPGGKLSDPKGTNQRVKSGSAGEPRLERDKAVSGKYSRGRGNKPTDDRRRAALDKLKKPKEYKGFVGGLKSSLGGDVISKNKEERSKAREELGRKTGKAIRSAPGKVAKAGLNAVKNAASKTGGSVGTSSGSGGDDIKRSDTQI